MRALASVLKMPPLNYIICSHSCEPLRYLSQGSLIVRGPSKINVSRKNTKKAMMKLPSKKVLEKLMQQRAQLNDEENVWLKSINLENLKLYRKTAKGSYKVINNNKLLEKLTVLKPPEVEDNSENDSVDSPKQLASVKPKNLSKQETELSEAKLSDFLIKNMLEFPLLKSNFESSKIEKSAMVEPIKSLVKGTDEKEINALPSVTKILTETMSGEAKFRLNLWRTKLIDELGKSGFLKHRKDLLNQGAKFHGSIRQYLTSEGKEEVRIDPVIEGCWKSLEHCLPDISDVKLLEHPIWHPLLLYRGIVDCVASYRNVPCVIEWKKADKRRPDLKGTYDAPLQICAYMGALSWTQDPKLTPLKSGLVVVAYTDGTPADLFPMNLEICESYWIEWLHRLQGFWAQRSSVSMEKEPATNNFFSEYL